jgi:hypothetical protein
MVPKSIRSQVSLDRNLFLVVLKLHIRDRRFERALYVSYLRVQELFIHPTNALSEMRRRDMN